MFVQKIILITVFFYLPFTLAGQLNGNNLFEFQLGNLPDTDPADLSTHYDQLNLQYHYNALKASVRYEQFLSQTAGRSYNKLSQYTIQYRKNGLDLKVGNFNEIFGNGLLLRAYEIPGSVFEDQAYRVRYGFYRDLRGVAINYKGKLGYIKAVRGKTLSNSLPPTVGEDDRRADLTEGIESGLSFFGQNAGAVLMRNTNGQNKENFYSLLFSGNVFSFLSYNFEYAHNLKNDEPLLQINDDTRYGIYGSLNFSYGSFGLSAEYKDYKNLLVGSGISDPPTLIKEFKYKLLNRSIHVPLYTDESGTQIEAYYSFSNGARLLLNYAKAINTIVSTYTFNEYFSEFYFNAGNKNTITSFIDYSQDPFKSEDNRYTAGLIWEYAFAGVHSTLLELEYQSVERNSIESDVFNNIVFILAYSKSPGTSISLTWELSTDPALISGMAYRNWFGLDFSQKINTRNTISLFAGQRRGGPACTSGVCYEVLDFEGIEFRFTTKF